MPEVHAIWFIDESGASELDALTWESGEAAAYAQSVQDGDGFPGCDVRVETLQVPSGELAQFQAACECASAAGPGLLAFWHDRLARASARLRP